MHNLASGGLYWLGLIAVGLLLLGTALYYQFVLEELPCVVCIQIRLWLTLMIMLAILGLGCRKQKWLRLITQISVVLTAIGLIERSYLLLGTERGFIFGVCGFDVGLPSWFAVEKWLPALYQVETSCGYTPELIWGITMADALMVFSVCLFMLSGLMLLMSVLKLAKSPG